MFIFSVSVDFLNWFRHVQSRKYTGKTGFSNRFQLPNLAKYTFRYSDSLTFMYAANQLLDHETCPS